MRKMLKKIKDVLNNKLFFDRNLHVYNDISKNIENEIIQNRLATGKLLERENRRSVDAIINNINLSEFKIFSQWGDDGIINFLINYLEIDNEVFVEFGVEDYRECNTRFLLMNNNWKGLIIDGSLKNVNKIKCENIYWQYDLTALSNFVTADNINGLLKKNRIEDNIGLLHIDIDGNDYWVWKSIDAIEPIIVVVEYNSLFGVDKPWTIPYSESFCRGDEHFSNLYYGSSLLSLCDLATEKGYSLIGCNMNGNNAYFVKNNKLRDLKVLTPNHGYSLSKFSESRDEKGQLTYLRGDSRLKLLQGKDIFNTRLGMIEQI